MTTANLRKGMIGNEITDIVIWIIFILIGIGAVYVLRRKLGA